MYVHKEAGWIELAHTVMDAEESQVLPPALSVAEDSLGCLILLLLPSKCRLQAHTAIPNFNILMYLDIFITTNVGK